MTQNATQSPKTATWPSGLYPDEIAALERFHFSPTELSLDPEYISSYRGTYDFPVCHDQVAIVRICDPDVSTVDRDGKVTKFETLKRLLKKIGMARREFLKLVPPHSVGVIRTVVLAMLDIMKFHPLAKNLGLPVSTFHMWSTYGFDPKTTKDYFDIGCMQPDIAVFLGELDGGASPKIAFNRMYKAINSESHYLD